MGWIKIAPNAQPNADGEWHEIDRQIPASRGAGWIGIVKELEPFVPDGFHIVALTNGTPVKFKVVE